MPGVNYNFKEMHTLRISWDLDSMIQLMATYFGWQVYAFSLPLLWPGYSLVQNTWLEVLLLQPVQCH